MSPVPGADLSPRKTNERVAVDPTSFYSLTKKAVGVLAAQ
jgi:hypothetical protein